MPKHNDNSPELKDWTTKKLKQQAIEYYSIVQAIEYYSIVNNGATSYRSQYRQMLDSILQELDNRGATPLTKLTF